MSTPISVIDIQITTDQPQQDGRFWVHEKLVLSDGNFIQSDYLADPNLDINAVASERAQYYNEGFAAQQAIKDEAMNYSVPISVTDFLDVIPREIAMGLMELRKTSTLVDLAITRLTADTWVYKANVQKWLDDLVNAQLISQQTSDAIIAAWTAKFG